VEVDSFRSQLEVSQAKLQRLERSNAHLRKQRAQMMADFQVSFAFSALSFSRDRPIIQGITQCCQHKL